MTERLPARVLDSRSTLYAACGLTLALGLFFIFVWAPHPWGWDGFDRYDTLAWSVAQRQGFPTLEVPWGYAYFVAGFYRAFGHRQWIPLVAQAALNACLPLLVFAFARTWLNRPTSMLAATLTGVLSFNTVYASTLSSDAVCTVIFAAVLVLFARARTRERWGWYAATGVLTGAAAQLRPNLILIPPLLAAYGAAERPTRRRLGHAATLLLAAAVTLTPWVVRSYRLTGVVLPSSVHGALQLWYGSLQVGPYLQSGAYNPRRVFEDPVFPYTSLEKASIFVTANTNDCERRSPSVTSLVYWTDRDGERRRLSSRPSLSPDGREAFEIPAVGETAVVYYYFETRWPSPQDDVVKLTPQHGEAAPFVYFISHDHLGDLDVHGDLLDIFDLIRIARHADWDEPLPFAQKLAAAGVGPADLETAAEILARAVPRAGAHPIDVTTRGGLDPIVITVTHDDREARILFRDGSSILIPRSWSGRITDVTFEGTGAIELLRSHESLAALARAQASPPNEKRRCPAVEEIAFNRIFYREELGKMQRYSALALDNIRREPRAFAQASVYRAFRVFFIQGSDDRFTAQQFERASAIYPLATAASTLYLLLFAIGVAVAWRRRYAIALPLVLIAYVPLTIAFLLTNMRYSVTVQPLLLMFIAVAIEAALEKLGCAPLTPTRDASTR
jgi:hypothetical protein